MRKINSFKITKLSVYGFKCFEKKTEFYFGDLTYISAANGLGKSSIADALAWAFAGTPFFGDGRGLDRLQNKNMDEMEVSVELVDETGTVHNLTRSRKRDNTTIVYDGYNLRQTDMNGIFGDRDTFLSILNPLYFIDILGEDGKSLLESMLPVIDHKTILSSLPESSRTLLADEQMLSPETYIKNRRTEIKELENSLISCEGQQELLEEQRSEHAMNLNGLKMTLNKVNTEIAQLEAVRDKDRDSKADELSLAGLTARRDELLSNGNNGDDTEIINLSDEIRKLESFIAEQSAQPYISQYTEQIKEAESNLKVMYAEHKRLSEALNYAVAGYKCPTCLTEITEKNVAAVKADLQEKLIKIINDGKEAKIFACTLIDKNNTALKEFEEQKSSVLEKSRSKLSELNSQLQELRTAKEIDAQNYNDTVASLNKKISALEYRKTHGNLTVEETARLSELQRSKNDCESKIEALGSVSPDYDFSKQIADTKGNINRLKILVNEASNYAAKRSELMLEGLRMNRAEISLCEVIKSTGELKDCFKFTFDGKNYKWLSLSEKIKAGIEVSQLIKRLSGRDYPVFIDNCESICTFDGILRSGQMITAKVVRDGDLRIVVKDDSKAA